MKSVGFREFRAMHGAKPCIYVSINHEIALLLAPYPEPALEPSA